MLRIHVKDLNELHDQVMDKFLWHPEEVVDLSKYPTTYSYDNLLTSDTCVFDFNLSSIGLTKARWARFLTQYVPRAALEKWLESISLQRNNVVNLLRSCGETDVAPDLHHPEIVGHRWGVCFLGVSFRRSPKPTMTLYSRAARMPTTAVMELALVSNLATEIKKRHEIRGPIRFVWFASVIHTGAWDVMAYLLWRKTFKKFMESGTALSRYTGERYEKLANAPLTKEGIPYGRQRRIAKRVQEINRGEFLPDCMTSQLSIWRGNKE